MEIQGKIKVISETKEYGSNGFKKREVVITTDGQYPQDILVDFVQEKCAILDKYSVGQDVNVGINLQGREWVNPEGVSKYFNSIVGWKIELLENKTTNQEYQQTQPTEPEQDDNSDNLPF